MFSKLLILLGLLTGALYAQSVTPNQVFSGPLANRPTTCQLNDLYFATDQPSTNNTFYCASQNNWILVSAAEVPIDLTVHNLIATGTITGSLVGNASTATALKNVPSVCTGGNKPTGIDVNGNALGCSTPSGGVSSVFGRTGAVTAVSGDYSSFYDAIGAASAAQTAAITAAEAFSANGSNITSGTVASARVPLAQTASNLAATPTACPANFSPTGVTANGNPVFCQPMGCPNIMNYGGNNGGSTPNDTAFAALIAANISDQQCVYFPAGHFKFTNAAAWTAPTTTASIVIKGDGSGQPQLIFPTAKDGIHLNLISTANAFHISGLTLRTQGVGTSVGINITNSGTTMTEGVVNSISDVSFQGDDCQACTDYWVTNIKLHNALNVAVFNNHIVGAPASGLGTGVAIDASGTPVSVVFNINGNEFDYTATGVSIGDNVQGVTMMQNNFVGTVNGISVPAGLTYGHDDELVIGPGNQFNGSSAGISILSPFRHTIIQGNYFVVNGVVNGIFLDQYAMTLIMGNHFINTGGAGGHGIFVNNYANDDMKIIGNDTQFFADGISLQSGSQHVSAFMNNGVGNTVDVLNLGTGNNVSLSAYTGTPTASFQVVDGFVVHQ